MDTHAHICTCVAIVVVLCHVSGGTLLYALKLYLLVGMLWADDIISIIWGDVSDKRANREAADWRRGGKISAVCKTDRVLGSWP